MVGKRFSSSLSLIQAHAKRVQGVTYDFVTFHPRTMWEIKDLASFYSDYCESLREEEIEGEVSISQGFEDHSVLAQKTGDFLPLIVDFNLIFNDQKEDPIGQHFIRVLVSAVQRHICEYFGQDNRDIFTCVVLVQEDDFESYKKKKQNDESVTIFKWKLRLYFPNLKTAATHISKMMGEPLFKLLREINIYKYFNSAPVDFDRNIKAFTGEPVPLYGTAEKKEQILSFEKCYGDIRHEPIEIRSSDEDEGGEDSESYDYWESGTLEVSDVFSVEDHSLVQTKRIDPRVFDSFSPIELLPFFLTIDYRSVVIQPKIENETPVKIETEDLKDFSSRGEGEQYPDDLRIAEDLLPMVAESRYFKKIFTIDIGKALHQASEGDSRGLKIWIKYIEKSCNNNKPHQYIQGGDIAAYCEGEYSSFSHDEPITIKTIAWYAKLDRPKEYEKWHNIISVKFFMKNALSGTHYAVAKAFVWHHWLEYACCDTKNKIVYHFEKSRWVNIDGAYLIRNNLSESFKKKFEQIRAKLSQHAFESRAEDKSKLEKDIKNLNNLIQKLENNSFKNAVAKEIFDQIYIRNFMGKLDSVPTLTGLPNGVVEVDYKAGTIDFRDGKPEDYISRITSVGYKSDLNWDHPRVVSFMVWMRKMFMEEDLLDTFLKLQGSAFIAGNLNKVLPLFTGDKYNAKSTLVKLMLRTWGMYAIKISITILTKGYISSDKPNPAAARLNGTRWAFCDEPEGDASLCGGPTKMYTGNDDFDVRTLHKEGGTVASTSTIIISSNGMVGVDNPDQAIKERMFPIYFRTTFLDKAQVPKTEEEQIAKRIFLKDPNFINEVEKYKDVLLWVAFQYFPKYAKEGLDKPESIQNFLKSYWAENDKYIMYINDKIELKASPVDFITVAAAYKDFDRWHMSNYRAENTPSRKVFRSHLIDRLGPPSANNCWVGIRFKDQDENIGSENVLQPLQSLSKNKGKKDIKIGENKGLEKAIPGLKLPVASELTKPEIPSRPAVGELGTV